MQYMLKYFTLRLYYFCASKNKEKNPTLLYSITVMGENNYKKSIL